VEDITNHPKGKLDHKRDATLPALDALRNRGERGGEKIRAPEEEEIREGHNFSRRGVGG